MIPKTQKSKTRHHYVPVFYMKRVFNFDNKKDQLLVFNRKINKYYYNSLTEINTVKDRYQEAESFFTEFEYKALHQHDKGNFVEFAYVFQAMMLAKDNSDFYIKNLKNPNLLWDTFQETINTLKDTYPYAKVYQTTEKPVMNDVITQSAYGQDLYVRLTEDSFILLSQSMLKSKTIEECNVIVRSMNEKYANDLKATIVFGMERKKCWKER